MKLCTVFLLVSWATAFSPAAMRPTSPRSTVVAVEMAKEAQPSVVSGVFAGFFGTFAVATMLSWNVAVAGAAAPPNMDVLNRKYPHTALLIESYAFTLIVPCRSSISESIDVDHDPCRQGARINHGYAQLRGNQGNQVQCRIHQ
jgi:hypothetical protein